MKNYKIEELYQKRKSWVQTTKDNNFDKGISNLLTELYPNNAHFIYELLQNAEDAKATEIRFELYEDSLWVRHNGRSFTNADIEGITSIGEGTKANDINKIGKFGVGFKAVFSYTNTPIIYSSDYNFEIHELVIPVEIEKRNDNSNDTLMKFPFNNPEKSREDAYSEIKKGLKKLDDNSLLFLNNLKSISYSYGDKSHKIIREELGDVEINITNSRKNRKSKWLRLKKKLPSSDKLFVSIAFRLEYDEKLEKEIIAPVNGHVFIFFPAEKETSKLKFHVHAPFASTVARDSIKDIPENDDLLKLISELATEALEYLRENNLLDFNFLKTLPIDEDELSEFYLPIQKKLIEYFNYDEYILTDSDTYECGTYCYRSSKKIKSVFDIDTLKFFEEIDNDEKIHWIQNPPQLNSREDKFLRSLQITFFDEERLLKKLSKFLRDSYSWHPNTRLDTMQSFLQKKNNNWIQQLYELLYDIKIKNENLSFLNIEKLIKLQNGNFNFNKVKCYFVSHSNVAKSNFNFVHNSVYEDNSKSKFLLEKLGVKEIDLKDEIKVILNIYNLEDTITYEDNIKHLEIFLKYYIEHNDVNIFKGSSFLINNVGELQHANMILVDYPLSNTKMHIINGIGNKYLLNECYNIISNKERFTDFLKAIGAHFVLPIEKRSVRYHENSNNLIEFGSESSYTIDEDFFIDGAERFEEQDFDFSLLIWDRISSINITNYYNIYKAKYRRVKNSQFRFEPSSLIIQLKKYAWIPDKNLNFYRPQDISQEMLHDDFKYNNENGWLTEIGFGENILKDQKEYKEKEKLANEISGLNLNTLKKLKDKGYTDDKILKLIEQDETKKLDENHNPNLLGAIKNHNKQIQKKDDNPNPTIILDETEYRNKAQEKLVSNLKKSRNNTKEYLSTQKIKVGKAETKDFLNQQYKGYCQICGFTFDQINDKGKYFEVFDWLSEKISKQKTNIIEAGSSLCLCANCHSAIKHGDFNADIINEINELDNLDGYNFTEFTELIDATVEPDSIPEIYSFVEMDMYKMPVHLLNKKQNIFYTEEHFLQFFNMLTLNQDNNNVDNITNADDLNFSDIDIADQIDAKIESIENSVKKKTEIKANSKVHIKYDGGKQILKIQLSRQRFGILRNSSDYKKINKESPLAKALIDHSVGDVVEVEEINKLVEIIDVVNN